MPIASRELSAAFRDENVVLFVDGVAQPGLRPGEIADELVLWASRPEEFIESAKALAALIVAARQPVAGGSVSLYWRGGKVLWQSAPNTGNRNRSPVKSRR